LAVGRADIGDQRDADGDPAAEPEPGREPRDRELPGVRDERGEQRCGSERGDAPEEHRLAANPVAEPAADHRAREHAKVARRQRRGEGDRGPVPCRDQLRHHVTERAQVVALEQDDQAAEQRRAQGEPLVSARQVGYQARIMAISL
jgi:hypothetical protein